MNLYINCSPRLKMSNSNYFINLLKEDNDIINYLYKDNYNNIIKNINKVNKIIFVFPLYVDTLPSKLIEFMEQFNNFNKKSVYIICNCGFIEYKHNTLALHTFKNYVKKNNGIFKGYFNIGSGEIYGMSKNNKFIKMICFKFFKKVNIFKNKIKNNNKIYINIQTNWLPKRLFCFIGNKSWKKKIK